MLARLSGIILALLLFGPVSKSQAAPCVLAADGRPRLPIVLSADATPSSRHMARELQRVLGAMIGTEPAIEAGDGARGIAVGTLAEFPALAAATDLGLPADFGSTDLATRQGYLLRSHAAGIQIIGASEIGVLNGGWDLLHRLGYRYLMPHPAWEIMPRKSELTVDLQVYERPAFAARQIAGTVSRDWCERNRLSILDSWKLEPLPYLPPHWQTKLVRNEHAWGSIVAFAEAEFAAHPEYYALVPVQPDDTIAAPQEEPDADKADALGPKKLGLQLEEAEAADQTSEPEPELKRVGSKLCVSNPAVRELAVRYALNYFEQHPGAPSVSMEPTDGSGWCVCADCEAIGPPSERVVLMANTVAEALAADYPEKYVGILAYHLHADPPKRRVHPRVVVSLATALSGRKPINDRLAEWAEVCDNVGVYEYLSVMEWHLGLPAKSRIAHRSYLATMTRDFHARNVRFFSAQATGGAWGGQAFGFYLISRLLWDQEATADVETILDDFLVSAFGTAAEPMRAYWEVVDASQAAPGNAAFFLGRAELMYAALREAKAATDDPAVQARLDQLVLYTRYVELVGQEFAARGTADHYPALVRLMRFNYRIRDYGMVGFGVAESYIPKADKVPLRPAPRRENPLALDEPDAVQHYVDSPITAADIAAILAGTSVIPTDDLTQADLPATPNALDLE